MMTRLGSITINVDVDADGNVNCSHETVMSEPLNAMHCAMSEDEKLRALHIRRAACKLIADFFLLVQNPDAQRVAL